MGNTMKGFAKWGTAWGSDEWLTVQKPKEEETCEKKVERVMDLLFML